MCAERHMRVKTPDRRFLAKCHQPNLAQTRQRSKKIRRRPGSAPARHWLSGSGALDVLGFGTFLAIDNFEVDQFSFLQGFEALPLDARMMDKDVLSSFLSDEPITPLVVEPFHFSTGHNLSPSMFWQRKQQISLRLFHGKPSSEFARPRIVPTGRRIREDAQRCQAT